MYDSFPTVRSSDKIDSLPYLLTPLKKNYGSGAFAAQGRDPYVDLVHLASEIGAAGIDLDYEEFWHADAFKTVDPSGTAAQGPWLLHQTVYKYAAIAKDLITAIEAISPTLKMSTAASAAGAWEGKWWGGNLKGLWLELNTQFPAIVDFMTKGANAGGLNIMTYDLRCAVRRFKLCDLNYVAVPLRWQRRCILYFLRILLTI